MNDLYSSARHWARLARQEDKDAFPGTPARYRADMYRRTARALLYQRKTGIAVCVCCFKPFGEHR